MASVDVHFENGNLNSPVLVLGDDAANPDNCIIVRLAPSGTASVPKSTISGEEGTPVDEEGNSTATVPPVA